MKNLTLLVSSLIIAAVAACRGSDTPPLPPPSGSQASRSAASASEPAQATLDGMDGRTPVPLLPMMANHQKENMRDHLRSIQDISAALAAKDFGAIEKAASRIGYSEQMGQMCTHMGAGAPGFTEAALKFHHTADTIAAAARTHDRGAVMTALGATLQTCTACHAAFRQTVVDEATPRRTPRHRPAFEQGHVEPAPGLHDLRIDGNRSEWL